MEMGAVVETSSHPINGMCGENGHGGRLSVQISLVDGFFRRAYTELGSRLT
jgi:hypothetical protein